jgi:hypothetical protein
MWSLDQPPFSLSHMPPFRLGGHFLDQYVMGVADDQGRAITMGRAAPVYRIKNFEQFSIGWRARTYYNARVAKEWECSLLANAELSIGFDGHVLSGEVEAGIAPSPYKPLISVPHCSKTIDVPIVNLTMS